LLEDIAAWLSGAERAARARARAGPLRHYWINLAGDTRRADWMRAEFGRRGLPHCRVDACTPDRLPPMTLPRRPYAQASALQIACLASHLAALDRALRDGEAAFLVMEDDIRLAFEVDHAALLETAPRGWEILQLHVVNAERVEQMHDGGYRQRRLWQCWEGANYSTGAYLCSRRGARRILRRFRRGARFDFAESPHPLIADHFLYWVARTFTLTYPVYIENGAFGSTLESEPEFHAASRAAIQRIWQESPAPSFASRRDALPDS